MLAAEVHLLFLEILGLSFQVATQNRARIWRIAKGLVFLLVRFLLGFFSNVCCLSKDCTPTPQSYKAILQRPTNVRNAAIFCQQSNLQTGIIALHVFQWISPILRVDFWDISGDLNAFETKLDHGRRSIGSRVEPPLQNKNDTVPSILALDTRERPNEPKDISSCILWQVPQASWCFCLLLIHVLSNKSFLQTSH